MKPLKPLSPLKPLKLLKKLDFRLKILFGMIGVIVLAVLVYGLWFFWATNVRVQYGDPKDWPEHVSDAVNLSFRYPPGFDIIVPDDEANNPVSIVKKGERGESVLMQVGTWQSGETFDSLDAVVERYKKAVSRRTLRSRTGITVDGFPGAMLVQDEPGGRRVIEVLVWDATQDDPSNLHVREISLQLPGNTGAVYGRLYQGAFRELVASLGFINFKDTSHRDRPSGIPNSWEKYSSSQGGYSLWKPRGWVVTHEAQEEGGVYTVALQPKEEANNKTAYDSGQETALIIHAGPQDKPVLLSDLDAIYAQPFRDSMDSVEKNSLEEEKFTFPGFGPGISLQGHKVAQDGKPAGLIYLVVMTAVGENPVMTPSRGYVLSAFLPDGDAQKENEDIVRRITRSLQPLKP